MNAGDTIPIHNVEEMKSTVIQYGTIKKKIEEFTDTVEDFTY